MLSTGTSAWADPVEDDRSESAAPTRPPVLLLSIAEAARALRLGRSKFYELIAAGEIETVHIGRARRVPVAAVEAYVERLRQGA